MEPENYNHFRIGFDLGLRLFYFIFKYLLSTGGLSHYRDLVYFDLLALDVGSVSTP